MGATSIWKNRNFTLFFSGQLISKLGDGIYTLGLIWMMHVLTNSGLMMSLTLATGLIPRVLIGPVIGVLVDRLPKRLTLVTTDFIRAALMASLTILTMLHLVPAWSLLVFSFVLSAMATLFSPAYVVSQKVVVGSDGLLQANSLQQISTNISQIAGPALAGLIIGSFGLGASFLIDTFTFVVSAISLLLVRFEEPPQSTGDLSAMSIARDIRGGASILSNIPLLRVLTPVMLLYNFGACGLENLLIVQFVSNILHRGVFAVGAMSTCIAIGELVSGLALTVLNRRIQDMRSLVLNMMISSVAIFAIGFSRSIWVMGALLLVAGFCISIINIVFFTSIQESIPTHALGRVSSLIGALFDVVTPPAQICFGALVAILPSGILISAIGAFGLLTGCGALMHPTLRRTQSAIPQSTPEPVTIAD